VGYVNSSWHHRASPGPFRRLDGSPLQATPTPLAMLFKQTLSPQLGPYNTAWAITSAPLAVSTPVTDSATSRRHCYRHRHCHCHLLAGCLCSVTSESVSCAQPRSPAETMAVYNHTIPSQVLHQLPATILPEQSVAFLSHRHSLSSTISAMPVLLASMVIASTSWILSRYLVTLPAPALPLCHGNRYINAYCVKSHFSSSYSRPRT
jgi:hypothetical protein